MKIKLMLEIGDDLDIWLYRELDLPIAVLSIPDLTINLAPSENESTIFDQFTLSDITYTPATDSFECFCI